MDKIVILNKNPENSVVTSKITIYGNKKELEAAESAIKSIPGISMMSERNARLEIQQRIDKHDLQATILFDGNYVWSMKRIITNLDRIITAGTLYDPNPHEQRTTNCAGRPITITHAQTEIPRRARIANLLVPTEFECILSHYFYEFLRNECGSIAHYNINGWVTEYPTLEALKDFFKCNEFGISVLQWVTRYIPHRTDTIEIVRAIEDRFYPLRARARMAKKEETQIAANSE